MPEDGVNVVEVGGGLGEDEELGPVGVRPLVRHGQQERLVVLHFKIFVFKHPAVDAFSTLPIPICKHTSLTSRNNSFKFIKNMQYSKSLVSFFGRG